MEEEPLEGPIQLRVTARCTVSDLAAPEGTIGSTVEELMPQLNAEASLLVRAFVRERAQQPTGTDRMSGLRTGGVPIYILRHGRSRALTWFDEGSRVVWLIAAHFSHRSGEHDDSYPYFRALSRDDLRPSRQDLTALRAHQAELEAEAVFDVIPELLEAAAANRGTAASGHVGPIPVRVMMESGVPPPHVHLGIGHRWAGSPDPPPNALVAIVTRVYSHEYDGLEDLPYSSSGPGGWELPDGEAWFEDFVSNWDED